MPHCDEVDAATMEMGAKALDGMMDVMRPISAIQTEEASEEGDDDEKPRKKGSGGKRAKQVSDHACLIWLALLGGGSAV